VLLAEKVSRRLPHKRYFDRETGASASSEEVFLT